GCAVAAKGCRASGKCNVDPAEAGVTNVTTLLRSMCSCSGGATGPLVSHRRAEHLLHEASSAAARGIARPLRVAPAVGPAGVRHTLEGHQALVVALLLAVVARGAGNPPVAGML